MNLVLIGYRGTGKTTVAQYLARELAWDWVDADVEIELRAGKSIAAIFEHDGEPVFRDWESKVIATLVTRDRTVIAAGGGVILREENRQALDKADVVVWLKAEVPTILARLATDATTASRRPNLTTSGGEDEIRQLIEARSPWYQQCSDIVVDTDDRAPEEIAAEILSRLQQVPPGNASGS